jgi:hypothetical protein
MGLFHISRAAFLGLGTLLLASAGPRCAFRSGSTSDTNSTQTNGSNTNGQSAMIDTHLLPFELRPGVIADPGQGVLYAMVPGGQIDAIDLRNGNLLWSTTQAAKPLLLTTGGLLLAQKENGNQLSLAELDTGKQGELVRTADIPLPAGVAASIDEGLGVSFIARACPDGGNAILAWNFSSQQISGAEPAVPPQAVSQSAAAVIDLATGAVSPPASGQTCNPQKPLIPDGIAPAGATPEPLCRLGDILAGLQSGENGQLLLVRWDAKSNQRLDDVPLFGKELTLRALSVDCQYVLASRLAENGTDWTWLVYSMSTGARVAEITVALDGAAFFIFGSNLIYESPPVHRFVAGVLVDQPLEVRAVALSTGALVWEHRIRDTTYQGSLPPGAP